MKSKFFTKSLVVVAITGLLTTTAINVKSQPGQGMMNMENRQQKSMCKIPNLTEDQQKKISDLKVKHLKEVTPLRNELNEKQAHLQTLVSAEKQEVDAINKTIDEIASVKAKLMKKRVAHRAEVSQLLTDDQKVYFNSRAGKGGQGNGFGKGKGRGRQGMHRGNGFQNCPMSN